MTSGSPKHFPSDLRNFFSTRNFHQKFFSTSGEDVQRGALFHSILIKPDDDDDDFYNNSSKKLSLVLDELERFLKKGKSSEFNSRHDGDIFGLPIPL